MFDVNVEPSVYSEGFFFYQILKNVKNFKIKSKINFYNSITIIFAKVKYII